MREFASPRAAKKVASKEYALWELQRVDHDGSQIVYEVWSVEPYAFLFGIHDDLTPDAKAIATSIVAEHNCRLVPTPSPSGTEIALEEAKQHIAKLTAFFMENPDWAQAAVDARAFISNVPREPDTRGEAPPITDRR